MTWSTRLVPGSAPDGRPVVSVLAKRTFRIEPGEAARPDPGVQKPWVEVDEPWGGTEPLHAAVKLESELVAWKPGTDVVVVGRAHAPRGRMARFFDAAIQVGAFRKEVRVFGDRRVRRRALGIAFTDPEPFESMPLHYGAAYGGRFPLDGQEMSYPRNPAGRGFAVDPSPSELDELRLPNLENPLQLLEPSRVALRSYDRWTEAPRPWALGFSSRNSQPRASLAGLPPDLRAQVEASRLAAALEEGEAPAGPSAPVANPDWHRGASEGLSLPFLRGDEEICLEHMDRDHPRFGFRLPGTLSGIFLDTGDGPEWMRPVLHDVVVHKGENRLTLVWRGSCLYGGPESMVRWTRCRMGVEG